MQKLFFTYILSCSDDSYYIGVTNDLIIRSNQHNSDKFPGSYCHTRRPVKLVFSKAFSDAKNAISYEKQIKRWSRKKKEALILWDFKKLHELAACKNQSSHKKFLKK